MSRRDAAFFDMDGVIAVYDRWAYSMPSPLDPSVRIYEDERLRYFRHCTPDPAAMALLRAACASEMPAYVLTTVRPDLPWVRFDKVAWLAAHAPWFDASTRLIVADSDKAQTVMAVHRIAGLHAGMVLFDDYNRNLSDWEAAGGTAVKWLNGLNTAGSWPGHRLSREDAMDALGVREGGPHGS